MDSLSRRLLLRRTAAAVLLGSSGCGTLLHPERRGQPAGNLDWKVVALDALGLLLFFIPGIIAFAVDFSTGAIYLPPGCYCDKNRRDDEELKLVTVSVPAERLTLDEVERVVSQHTEREVRLRPGTYQTQKLNKIDDFWAAANKLWPGRKAA